MNKTSKKFLQRSRKDFQRDVFFRFLRRTFVQKTVLISSLYLLTCSNFPSALAKPIAEKSIPVLNVVSLEGDTIRLSDIVRDKPVFLFFWATWCKVCAKDLRRVYELQDEFADEVDFWGIAWKDKPEAIKSYFAKKQLNLSSYIDSDGSVFDKLNIKQTPVVAIINTRKKIIYLGYGSFSKFSKLLRKEIASNK